jgi:hypothetical protein
MQIEVGDRVRVHYHPPEPKRSFAEGVVSRTDVPTLGGRAFVFDVAYEAIFERGQFVRDGYQNYVLYTRSDDFAGRIEVLSRAATEPAPASEPAPDQTEAEVRSPPTEADPFEVQVERAAPPKRNSLISVLFRK